MAIMTMEELNNSKSAKTFTGEGKLTLDSIHYTENADGKITAVINVIENYRPIYINNVNVNEMALANLDDFLLSLTGKDNYSRNEDDINLNSGKKFYVRMESNTTNGRTFYNARFREKFTAKK